MQIALSRVSDLFFKYDNGGKKGLNVFVMWRYREMLVINMVDRFTNLELSERGGKN